VITDTEFIDPLSLVKPARKLLRASIENGVKNENREKGEANTTRFFGFVGKPIQTRFFGFGILCIAAKKNAAQLPLLVSAVIDCIILFLDSSRLSEQNNVLTPKVRPMEWRPRFVSKRTSLD
jgi:hypothetical protein